jgi:hypothetical protein
VNNQPELPAEWLDLFRTEADRDVARVRKDRDDWTAENDAETPRWRPGFEHVRQSRA